MITQIGGPSSISATKDPRRKAQTIKFKNRSVIPYKGNYNNNYERQKKSAFWTSISIVAGAVLFTMGYFMLSAFDKAKKAI